MLVRRRRFSILPAKLSCRKCTAQIKRFVVNAKEGSGLDEVTLVLSRVSSQDRQAIADKIQALSGVNQVSIVTRADDQAILDAL